MPRKLKVGSLFAGIGWICSAFEQAGCDVVWANEYNKNACLTYKNNFPETFLKMCGVSRILPEKICCCESTVIIHSYDPS